MKAAAAAMPEALSRFDIVIEAAYPSHDFEEEEEGDCQCRDCQEDRGELGDVPEPTIIECFY